jgi:hypothetical protein
MSNVDASASIVDFYFGVFPPNREVDFDFYFGFLPAKSRSRFLLRISSRQIEESISIRVRISSHREVDFYSEFLPLVLSVDEFAIEFNG